MAMTRKMVPLTVPGSVSSSNYLHSYVGPGLTCTKGTRIAWVRRIPGDPSASVATIGIDVLLTRYGQSAHIFSKRVGSSPAHAVNSTPIHHYDMNLSARRT